MNSPFDILGEYERRSVAHVLQRPEKHFSNDLWRGVGYRVGTRRLASDFREVVEIVAMPPITPVPRAQPWLLGVGSLRGSLFPVVDLKQFMEGRRSKLSEGQRVIIMHQDGGNVALTIDELYGQRSFEKIQGVSPEDFAHGRYAYLVDRAFRSGGQIWGIFSLAILSRTPEFRQAAI